MYSYEDTKEIFIQAHKQLLKTDLPLLEINISERTLCGRLMIYLNNELKNNGYKGYEEYYVDIEYNRKRGRKAKDNKFEIEKKTIGGTKKELISITCDLIVHKRNPDLEKDNLIAIELKKSTRKSTDKDYDRDRLKKLTKEKSNQDSSHNYGYVLGVYYEINLEKRQVDIEYYQNGERVSTDSSPIPLNRHANDYS